MIRLFATLLLFVFSTSAQAMDLTGANGLIDFDAAVGFVNPRTIKVFRSADPDHHLYFLVPNSIRLVETENHEPEFSLFHSGAGAAKEGYVTFSLQPIIDTADIDAVVAEIKGADGQARFAVPQPVSSYFYIIGPAMGAQPLTIEKDGGNPLLTKSSFSAKISSIAVRASLQPTSHSYPIFTIGHDFRLRGTSRDPSGNVTVVDRNLATSFVMYGRCALAPHSVVDLVDGTNGCIRQHYAPMLVRQVQRLLKAHGYDPGPLDGTFGTATEDAIRLYQRASGLVADGLPTAELLKALKS
jgi:hypothetical protein